MCTAPLDVSQELGGPLKKGHPITREQIPVHTCIPNREVRVRFILLSSLS